MALLTHLSTLRFDAKPLTSLSPCFLVSGHLSSQYKIKQKLKLKVQNAVVNIKKSNLISTDDKTTYAKGYYLLKLAKYRFPEHFKTLYIRYARKVARDCSLKVTRRYPLCAQYKIHRIVVIGLYQQ